jgi:uncharacterized protein YjbJ (UPF0337 family)
MRLSSIIAVVIGTAVGLSATTSLHCPVWAQTMPPSGPQTMPPTGQGPKPGARQSITEATGQLKTDTGKTTDDVKAMDVNKAKQDSGQVKEDVQGLKESTKDTLTNPFGK